MNIAVAERADSALEYSVVAHKDKLVRWALTDGNVNAIAKAQTLIRSIQECNRSELGISARFEQLSSICSAIKVIARYLNKESHFATLPCSRHHLRAAHVMQNLLYNAANGFNIITYHLAANKADLSQHKKAILVQSIYLSVDLISQAILQSYKFYKPIRNNAWRHLNQLLLTAERLDIIDYAAPGVNENSILHKYKRIALLHLADPYTFFPYEAENLYIQLDNWVLDCRMFPSGTQSPANKCFVDLAKDHAPMRTRTNQGWMHLRPKQGRIIDISTLLVKFKLYFELGHSPSNAEFGTINVSGERRHSWPIAWSTRRERASQRTETQDTLLAVTGFQQVFTVLTKPAKVKIQAEVPIVDEAMLDLAIPGDGAIDVVQASIWHQHDISAAGMAASYNVIDSTASQSQSCSENMLRKDTYTNNLSVCVGTLVAFQSMQDSGGEWQYGVIRRLQNIAGKKYRLGVELSKDHLRPVHATLVNGRGKRPQHIYAFLKISTNKNKPLSQILLPPGVCQEGAELCLQFGPTSWNVRLTKLLESNATFHEFEHAILNL